MKIFNNNLRSFVTSPIKLFIVFILPIIFVMLFVAGESGDIKRTITIIDKDNTQLTQALKEEISRSCNIVEIEESRIMDALINAKIDYAVTIPNGYTQKILAGEDVFLEEKYFINEVKIYPLMEEIKLYINNAVNISKVSQSEEEFYDNLRLLQDYKVVYNQKYEESLSVHKTVSALGFMMQFIMYSGIIAAAMLLRDKESNSTVRILVSPTSMSRYLLEHFASYIVFETFICFYLLAVLKWGFGYYFGEYYLIISFMMVVFSVSIIAFCILIVAVCKKSLISYWVLIVLTTPMLIFGGCYFELTAMPKAVQNASNFLPTKWMIEFARDTLIDGNIQKAGVTVVVLLAFALVYLSISRIGIKSLLKNK